MTGKLYLCNRNDEQQYTRRVASAGAVSAEGGAAADAGEFPATAEKVVHGVLLSQPHQYDVGDIRRGVLQ